jgi:hypothetical protein
MGTSEVTQKRIADLEANIVRLKGDAEKHRKSLSQTLEEIGREEAKLCATRLTLAENEAVDRPTSTPRETVRVEAVALPALRLAPMTEDQLAISLGIDQRRVHQWALRALRDPAKIRRNGSGVLEAIS